MSSQVLAGELAAISSESKRKFPDIRAAADKSLQELKALPSTSEQQIAADLSRRPQFIDPFIQAAISKNVRLANSAIVSLQRLVIIKGLPRSRLQEVLEAFSACTALSLDVQLKILQALPALVQNYSDDLKGGLVASALYVCAVLQSVKVATVSAIAAATLQQLVVSVFDKITAEDAAPEQSAIGQHVQVGERSVPVREAAWDAYRVLQDLILASEGKKTDFLGLPNFSQNLGLELIYAALNTYPDTFASHPELIQLMKDLLAPLLIRLMSDRHGFALSLRAMRLVPMIIQRHAQDLPDECEILIGLLTHLLDPESSPTWKRTMVMEVLKTMYANAGLIFTLCVLYDADEKRKPLVRENISAFVRLSTEKPALIGLGPQSSIPVRQVADEESVIDPASLEATGGFASTIPTTAVVELDVPGLSSQWSIPKVPILDLLDKNDAPTLPETYIYTLTLECLNSLADNLAKVVLPLTINQDPSSRRKPRSATATAEQPQNGAANRPNESTSTRPKRAMSYRSSTMPVNPLALEHSSSYPKVKAIATLIDSCWPALLATSSTFLYSALDNDYYRALIRSVQRFTQVAGLLELYTARDAFLTTLGKTAVPPHLISSLLPNGLSSPGPKSPMSARTKSVLSISSAATSQSNETIQGPRGSVVEAPASLSTRNMLCLRALINLAIALGPTMRDSFGIILSTLQQADLYLDYIRQTNATSILSTLGPEIEAVAAATKRLLESTADYPNESFQHVLESFCRSLDNDVTDFTAEMAQDAEEHSPSFNDFINRASGISAVQADSPLYVQDRSIILSKLGFLADINTSRFATYDPEASQWHRLLACLTQVAATACFPKSMAFSSADIICRSSVSLIQVSSSDNVEGQEEVQKLALDALRQLVRSTFESGEPTGETEVAIFCRVLEAIRSILEISGESLSVGWDIILESVDLAVAPVDEHAGQHLEQVATSRKSAPARISTSPELSRVAFSVVQLICADFLQSLNSRSLVRVIDILYNFASQRLDLNISLTSITLFSEASNFLLRQNALPALGDVAALRSNDPRLLYETLRKSSSESRAAQWIILLYQLSEVAADNRGEIRNAAFQTLLRIITNQSFSSDAVQLVFNCVLLKCLTDIVKEQKKTRPRRKQTLDKSQDVLDTAAKSVLEGLSSFIAHNVELFESTSHFEHTWENLISAIKDVLSCGSHTVNRAVYAALSTILSSLEDSPGRWEKAIKQIDLLWRSDLPKSSRPSDSQEDQQDAYIAYIGCVSQLVRLNSGKMGADRVRTISNNAVLCAQSSTASKYGNDESNMTKLQKHVLDLLKSLRTGDHESTQALVEAAATIIRMPFELRTDERITKRPSYVAFSKAAMDWLRELILAHSTETALYTSEAIAVSLEALGTPIKIKYHWSKTGAGPAPWKKATATALEVVAPILSVVDGKVSAITAEKSSRIWSAVVVIAAAIVKGDYTPLPISTKKQLVQEIEDDERSDVTSFLALRSVLMPQLGSTTLGHNIRNEYCSALFSASVIHSRSGSSSQSTEFKPLDGLLNGVQPALHDAEPSRREDLAFLCLAELVGMVSVEAQSFPWHQGTTFTGDYEPGNYGAQGSDTRRNLAQAAAPWLIARFALSLKAYIADQPLRGASRIPISMAQELIWILDRMAGLRCEPTALDSVATISASRPEEEKEISEALAQARGKERMHITLLHPLLIKAIGVAGHPRHGDAAILQALMRVLSQPR